MHIQDRHVFRCDYCPKHYLTPSSAERHERHCRRNPKNAHVCFGCAHLQIGQESITDSLGNPRTVKRFTCGVFGERMFTYVAEQMRFADSLVGATRMPTYCAKFKAEEPDFSIPF